jgi:hypothetical protein
VRFGQGQTQSPPSSPRSIGGGPVASAAVGTLPGRGVPPAAPALAPNNPPMPPGTPAPPPYTYTPSGPGTLTPPKASALRHLRLSRRPPGAPSALIGRTASHSASSNIISPLV